VEAWRDRHDGAEHWNGSHTYRPHPAQLGTGTQFFGKGVQDGDRGGLAEWKKIMARTASPKCALTSIGLLIEGVTSDYFKADMRRMFQFVDHSVGVILNGNLGNPIKNAAENTWM
jgi:hypothetical protein